MVSERAKIKERLIHFIEHASQHLRLHYQPTLHAIQLLGVFLTKHPTVLKEPMKDWNHARCLAISLLRLCYNFYDKQPKHLREWVVQAREDGPSSWDSLRIATCISEWQLQVVKLLKWKLAIPLLYDEVMMAGQLWGQYHASIQDFPLSLSIAENHNSLVSQVKICLYNYDLLIQHNSLESLSLKTKKIALALFSIAIKSMIKQNFKTHYHVISSRFSCNHMLQEFLKLHYQVIPEHISHETNEVNHLLNTHTQSRSHSKPKKERKEGKENKDHNKHKTAVTSYRHSEDKENHGYYIKRKRMRSQNHEEHTSQKHKSRSQPKKGHGNTNAKSQKKSTIIKSKKKSSSTKSILVGAGSSILAKTSSLIKPPKQERRNGLGVKVTDTASRSKKTLKYNISRASKRSDKSHHGSKLTSHTIEEFTSKSSYWNKAQPLKTDKKSTTSSIRMKLR